MKNLENAIRLAITKALKESMSRSENIKYYTTVNGPCTVYIGDPCYFMTEEYYKDLIISKAEEQGVSNDGHCIFHSTYMGDGDYLSSTGHNYGVDSGLLSICAMFDINDIQYTDDCTRYDLGEGEHELSMRYIDGEFIFNIDGRNVENISTNDPDEEEDDYEEEEEFEEDDL